MQLVAAEGLFHPGDCSFWSTTSGEEVPTPWLVFSLALLLIDNEVGQLVKIAAEMIPTSYIHKTPIISKVPI